MSVRMWGVCLVRDEIDVIEHVLRHVAAQGATSIIAADRGSTDGTRELMENLDLDGCDLIVQTWDTDAFAQGAKMTELCDDAVMLGGAEWIIPFDCDELFMHPDGILADVLADSRPITNVRYAALTHHYRTARDAPSTNPFVSMAWRTREFSRLPKLAVRWQPGMRMMEGNHGVLGAPPQPVESDRLVVHHFPWRSEEQTIRKVLSGARALALTGGLPPGTGEHYRVMAKAHEERGEDALRAWYRDAFFFDDPEAAGLVYDPVA